MLIFEIQTDVEFDDKSHSMLNKAIILASQAHFGQVDKSGMPYILHPIRLLIEIEKDYRSQGLSKTLIEDICCAAVLHDVLEDSQFTAKSLKGAGINSPTIKAVELLTRAEDASYKDYIQSLINSKNIIALIVKYADLTDNQDLSRLKSITQEDLKRNARYADAARLIYPELQLLINKHRK